MGSQETLEGTFAMIKPDAVHKSGAILERIANEGFLVVEQQKMRLTARMAESFYGQHQGADFFRDLIDYMISGDVIALCLARKNGINHWRSVLGPTKVSQAIKTQPESIRAQFGDPMNDMHNACHGSDSPESSEREIELIFPHIIHGSDQNRPPTAMVNGQTLTMIDSKVFPKSSSSPPPQTDENTNSIEEAAAHNEIKRSVSAQPLDNKEYLQQYVCPTLLKGLSEMYETRPQSPIAWLADWLDDNNPYKG